MKCFSLYKPSSAEAGSAPSPKGKAFLPCGAIGGSKPLPYAGICAIPVGADSIIRPYTRFVPGPSQTDTESVKKSLKPFCITVSGTTNLDAESSKNDAAVYALCPRTALCSRGGGFGCRVVEERRRRIRRFALLSDSRRRVQNPRRLPSSRIHIRRR